MKFLAIKLKNFKPYYASGEPQELILYDEKNDKKNITLNIGQTGYGKTSISEAILWCLFGEGIYPNWEELVNTLSIEVAREMKSETAEMSVEVLLEKSGRNYKILRQGNYDINGQKKAEESKLYIIHNGEPLTNPGNFIADNFPVTILMEYFIFDADDILKKFELNQEKTISDHINKLIGVEELDNQIAALEEIDKIYEKEISNIESQIKNEVVEEKDGYWRDKKTKEEAVKKLKNEIEGLSKKCKRLFEKSPSPAEQRLFKLITQKDDLKEELNRLNEQLILKDIVSDLDLLIVEPIITSMEESMAEEKTSKEEFSTSSKIIQTSLGDKYSGVFFEKKGNPKVIKKETNIDPSDLEDVEKLGLEVGGGHKSDILKILFEYKEKIASKKEEFNTIYEDYRSLKKKLIRVQNQINQIGETAKTKQTKEKYDKFLKIESNVMEKEKLKQEIQNKIDELDGKIKDCQERITLNKSQEKEKGILVDKRNLALTLVDISKKARERFLSTLIDFVNDKASDFLRKTVKDTHRFNSIEIDTNYQFNVKQKNGEPLKQNQINKGTLTISMLSFFFGLSNYLEKEIPYVIDNPMIRLDPGHDKRLIKQLVNTSDQVILHLIPGKEYTSDSFKWLKPYLNIQNWIYRNEYEKRDDLISTTERKNEDSIVDFDIDKF